MPKEILSKDQIKQIATAMSSDEAGLPESEARLSDHVWSVEELVSLLIQTDPLPTGSIMKPESPEDA
jgi:hypothetical protein